MTTVEIEYCVPCGMLERALNVEASILRQFGDKLERVSLVTGDHGIFVVRVDGEQIFDKDEDGFDVDEIVRRVKPHVGS
ncbi:selenoprotein W-related protein [Halohasta litchfieldiae]|uniref:Selenoprotein W-related protein n=1 Tax=Halohasta litchfieldiae TaxID=1073996 RepID=A0A1H6SIA4_9EURY|nr:Rdx family protein [Halohasta litchfieldiae]ATW87857.1 selenoprotein W-related protein [Halohasta litchfieldiae]SEI63505.1 selenoprotein W-related protein [Halohasta litchfieldiae]